MITPRGHSGATVVEAIVSLLLTLGLLGLLSRLAVRQRGAGETLARRAEVVEARRVTRDLIAHAVAGGVPRAGTGGEVVVRSFVGWAIPCVGGGWRYRGRRLPDAERDSLWVVDGEGRVAVVELASSRNESCATALPGEEGVELVFEGGGGALLRVFESGRFRLDDALRYGRIGEGAQPLTAAALDPGASRIQASATGLVVTMRGAGDSSSVSRAWPIR